MSLAAKIKELHPKRFFLETWQQMDNEAAQERSKRADEGLGYDWRPLLAFCFGAVFLTLMEYWGMPSSFQKIVRHYEEGAPAGSFFATLRISPWWELCNHGWWAAWRVLGFFIMPLIVVVLSGERIRDQGLSTEGFFKHLWIYGLCLGVVLACVIAVSFDEEFVTYYPFYKGANRSWLDFWIWELLYAAQFFSLEFFFRGWWLKAGKSMMGSHAIFAMVVPYVMIHYGKPLPETLAAIIAGVVLGTLAMKTRSIWSGFLIHVSVAISMDLAALAQTTGLPEVWTPPF